MQSPLRKLRKSHGYTLQHVAKGVQVASLINMTLNRSEVRGRK